MSALFVTALLIGALQEPVALAESPDSTLNVACADGSLLRLSGTEVEAAVRIAPALSDLIALNDGKSLAATGPEGGEVFLLRSASASVAGRRVLPGANTLVQAQAALVIASTEARRLFRITMTEVEDAWQLSDEPELSLELPFAPLEMATSPDGRLLVVASAYGGELALVDPGSWRVLAMREVTAHNIRGLCIDGGEGERGDRLLVAHQILDPLAHASFEDVHWGNIVRNVVREIALADLLITPAPSRVASRVLHLGDVGRGAGDPSSLLIDGDGRYVVTLGGTDELLLADPARLTEQRLQVGRRPLAAVLLRDGRTIAVANTLDRTISYVDLAEDRVTTVALGEDKSSGAIARGRELFFDARLSHDGWMSCHSCHTDGQSSEQLADTLGDGTHGTPKRVLSLFGVGDTAPYAWNGSQSSLEQQIEKTLRTTMHSDTFDESTVDDLAAYLRSLSAPEPKLARSTEEARERGRGIFRETGCIDCHVPPLFTSAKTYAVDLTDEAGLDLFNPPSLRGVGSRSRLFHDGRYRVIEELLASAAHQGSEAFDVSQITDVAAYLRTL